MAHPMITIAQLRRRLPPGATYVATWVGPMSGSRNRTTHRRVVSQSPHVMQSTILDGPQAGHVMRLDWAGVTASEYRGVVTLRDDESEFFKIDTIST